MKRITMLLALAGLCVAVPIAAENGKASLVFTVRVTDYYGKETYHVMSQAELDALNKEILAENKFFDQAMAAAKKTWDADELTRKKSFQKSAVKKRTAKALGKATDETKAGEKASNLDYERMEKERRDLDKLRKQWESQKLTGEQQDVLLKKMKDEDNNKSLVVRSFETALSELTGKAKPAADAK